MSVWPVEHESILNPGRSSSSVAAAGLDPEAERLVLGGNAARLLGLEVHR